MKKILIFSTAYLPFVGGAEIAVREITNRISNWEFDMITSRFNRSLPKFERMGNVNVYRVGFGYFFDKFLLPFQGCLKAFKINEDRNYDLIWAIMASQAGIAASFFKIKFPQKKLLLTLQEGDEEEHLKRYVLGIDFLYKVLIRPWHLLVFKKADFITTISHSLKNRAFKNKIKCEVQVIPNGVNRQYFSQTYSNGELKKLKNRLKINNHEKVLITTSRLVKKNAVGDIIKALSFLPKNFKLLILGIGPEEGNLKLEVQKLNLDKRVLFLGQIDYQELPKYLKISDIFVRPSLSEGLGNSFLEAMAVGLPVIGTQVGGIADFLFDQDRNPDKESTGWVVDPANPQAIAQAVKKILADPQKTKKIIANAKRLVSEKYDWDIIAKKMEEVFYKILKKS